MDLDVKSHIFKWRMKIQYNSSAADCNKNTFYQLYHAAGLPEIQFKPASHLEKSTQPFSERMLHTNTFQEIFNKAFQIELRNLTFLLQTSSPINHMFLMPYLDNANF
jgi:hypothetical protein